MQAAAVKTDKQINILNWYSFIDVFYLVETTLETFLIHFHVSPTPDNFMHKYEDSSEKSEYMENDVKVIFNHLGTYLGMI